MTLQIESYCNITDQAVYKNGELIFTNKDNLAFADYSKKCYKERNYSYSKFFKMDELCKLAFLACEVILEDTNKGNWNGENVAVVLGNKSSSISTDQKHFDSIKDKKAYFPSPAVFVYTLPNIMLGEICIRHGIKGENSCFIQESFDGAFLSAYVHDLFLNENIDYCITGWVDYLHNKYEAHLFLVSKAENEEAKEQFDKNFTNKRP